MELINLFMLHVCPAAGCVLASLMFCAPLRDLNHSLQRGSLGTLNPVPWAFAVGNNFGWLLYGFILKDVFVLAANLPGLFINMWLCYGAAKLEYHGRQKQGIAFDTARSVDNDNGVASTTNIKDFDFQLSMTPLEQVFFAISISWATLGSVTGWFMEEQDHAAAIIGITANCNLVFFYMAPLNTIWNVMKTQNSALIHRPTMTMNTLNAAFWVLYGTARRNRIIIFPNVIGVLLGIIQIFVCVLYPHMPVMDNITNDDNEAFERGHPSVDYDLMDEQSRSS